MRSYADIRGLRRVMLPVPLLTPRLSGGWLALVTPLYYRVGRGLIEGVRNETVVRDPRALEVFPIRPLGLRECIVRALHNEDREQAHTRWSEALPLEGPRAEASVQLGSRLIYTREVESTASPEEAFLPIQYIGGHTGWYSYPWLWSLRSILDKLFGGVGGSRGRRDPLILLPGDVVDFWRVERLEQYRLLRLRAEMKIPGRGWLQFEVSPRSGAAGSYRRSLIRVTAVFEPLGLGGRLYWFVLSPFHLLIFRKMLRNIAAAAEHGN